MTMEINNMNVNLKIINRKEKKLVFMTMEIKNMKLLNLKMEKRKEKKLVFMTMEIKNMKQNSKMTKEKEKK